MTRHGSHDETHERVNHHRPLRQRHTPFTSLLLVAWVVVPALGGLFALVGTIDDHTGRYGLRLLIIILVLTLAPLVAAVALVVGWKVTKRVVSLVYAHLAVTVMAVGLALAIFAAVGFNPVWLVIYGIFSLATAGAWGVYRTNALRADPREPGERTDWGKLFGVPETKIGQVVDDGYARRAKVTMGAGETVADLQSALPKVSSAANTLPGRAQVIQDPEHAREGELVIAYRDPLKEWPVWRGPSHFGGSYTDPICTAIYEDGEPQRYWFAAGLTDQGEPRPASHMGRQGMTRSGKTGDAKLELTEVMTRRDAVAMLADLTKGAQTAPPLLGGLTLYAHNKPQVGALLAGLERMIRGRAERLGAAGYNDWTPACYDDPDLRMPAVHVFMDEAAEFIMTRRFVVLAGAGLSTGTFLSISLQRADFGSMPTTGRASIGQWKCFGVIDDEGQTASFALSDETVKAGAHPERWGATKPGYHYLDGAPGVDERRYSTACRSFRHDDQTIREVIALAAQVRAVLPPADIADLGDAWTYCQPTDAPAVEDLPDQGKPPSAPTANPDYEEDDMDDMDDEEDDDMQIPAMSTDADPKDAIDYAGIDPREPLSPFEGEPTPFPGSGKPAAASPEEAASAFDVLLVQLALDRERTQVTLDEIDEMFPYRSLSWLSRRLSAVADGAIVSPPGLTLERTDPPRAGVYDLIRVRDEVISVPRGETWRIRRTPEDGDEDAHRS